MGGTHEPPEPRKLDVATAGRHDQRKATHNRGHRVGNQPRPNEGLSKIDGAYSWPHTSQLQASQLLFGAVRDRTELAENLGPQGPRLLAAQVHPWVWLPAANVWQIGHRRDAIQRAATSVFDDQLRAKVDRYW
jgi:hypothetical protein